MVVRLNKNFVDPAQDFALEFTCQNFNQTETRLIMHGV